MVYLDIDIVESTCLNPKLGVGDQGAADIVSTVLSGSI